MYGMNRAEGCKGIVESADGCKGIVESADGCKEWLKRAEGRKISGVGCSAPLFWSSWNTVMQCWHTCSHSRMHFSHK